VHHPKGLAKSLATAVGDGGRSVSRMCGRTAVAAGGEPHTPDVAVHR